VESSLDVLKKDQHGLDIAVNLMCFLRPRWIWRFPLRRLLLCLRVITIHPCFITGYDTADEVGVVSGLLFEFPADRNSMVLLIVAQQSWHKFRRNATRVQIVRQNSSDSPVWQSYYLTNILDSSPARIASRTFAMFSGVVLVDGRPEHSSSSTEVRHTPKRLYHKKSFALAHYIISDGFL
jgi:hypothetical protein